MLKFSFKALFCQANVFRRQLVKLLEKLLESLWLESNWKIRLAIPVGPYNHPQRDSHFEPE
jgi:hypothetical protein